MTLAQKLRLKVLKTEDEKSPIAISNPQTDKEPPPSLIGLIDDVLERKTHKLNFFRPSMLGGCDRANVFHYMNAPYHPSRQNPRMMRILDNGTVVHELIQKYLADHPEWWFAPESRIYVDIDGAWIRGSCDGVLIRRSDGYKFGIEIKTINHDEWLKLTKPKEGHVFQAGIYANVQKLTWVTVLYWDKNTQNLKEYPIKCRKSHYWENMKARVKELKGFIDRGELPRYDPSKCSTDFCNFVDFCRKKGAPV